MKHIFVLLVTFSALAGAQTWTQRRAALPGGTILTATYSPAYANPNKVLDGQESAFWNSLENCITVFNYDPVNATGEWANGVYCYDPSADDGTSTSGAGTGWRLLWSSLNAGNNSNGGLSGVNQITSLTCNNGVVTIVVPNNAAKMIRLAGVTKSNLSTTDIYTTWLNAFGFSAVVNGATISPITTNHMFPISAVNSTRSGTYGNLYTSWSWNDPGCANGTWTSSNSTFGTIAIPDEYPDMPMRRHFQGVAYDSARNAIWMGLGVGDVNSDATVINSAHSGMVDFYKMTKSTNWSWQQVCGLGNSPSVVGSGIPATSPGPGSTCGQEFTATTGPFTQNVDGFACLDLTPGPSGGATGAISSGGSGASCGAKFPYAGYDATNDVVVYFGGYLNSPLCETVMYYPASNTWKHPYDPTKACGSTAPAHNQNLGASRLVPLGNGKLLLFGGATGGGNTCPGTGVTKTGCLGDTWIFQTCASTNMSACGWHKVNSTANPAADADPVIDYDSNLGVVVLIGKEQPNAHTWFFYPATEQWVDQNYSGGPSLTLAQNNGAQFAYNSMGAYDPVHNLMVIWNSCNSATLPTACSPTTMSVWTLSLPNGTATGPQISFSPNSINFGNQIVNTTSAPQAVTLINPGASTLTVSSITAPSGFTVSSTTCGNTLPPAGTCTINVTFTPTVITGYSGTLAVADTPDGISNAATLLGTGVSAPDTTPPTISITSPAAGTYTGSLNISGNSSDNVGVAKVVLMYGSSTLATLTSNFLSWSFVWDTSAFAGTSTTLTAIAYDAAGNSSSASIDISIVGTAASVSVPATIHVTLYPHVRSVEPRTRPTAALSLKTTSVPAGVTICNTTPPVEIKRGSLSSAILANDGTAEPKEPSGTSSNTKFRPSSTSKCC